MLTSDAGLLEVTELEAWLEGDLKCQMQHGKEGCSIHVVARGVSCATAINVCENGRSWHLQKMAEGWKCAECKKFAADCWRIIPI